MTVKRILLFATIFFVSCFGHIAAPSAQVPLGSAAPTLVDQNKVVLPPPIMPLAPIATKLGQTIQTLVGASSSLLAADGPPDPSDANEDPNAAVADTFATQCLDALARVVDTLKAHSTSLASDASAYADFVAWIDHQKTDPRRQSLWQTIGSDLVLIIGVPLLAGIAISLFMLPLRLRFRARVPSTMPQRVGLLLGLFILRLLPVLVFLGSSLFLLEQNEAHRLARFVLLNVIYAFTSTYTIRQILRLIFAPHASHLRYLPLTTPRANYAFKWFSTFSIIIISGYFFIDVATALRVPDTTIIVFQNAFGCILTLLAIVVIFQTRMRVAAILRGKIVVVNEESYSHAIRLWLARHWHRLTTAYLILGLGVVLLGINNGIAVMLRGTISTLVILALARLCFIGIDRWTMPTANTPSLVHRQILAVLLRPFVWIFGGISIAVAWGYHLDAFIATTSGQRVTTAFLSILLTLIVLTALYELLNSSIDRHLSKRDKFSTLPVASARSRTLLPMVRNTVFILFSGIAILTFFGAVGVNVEPILAGAGVVGVAIGFGSQTLVKDFLTGLFIVIENTVAVGDIVKIGDFGGVVEAMSVRTIRLRDSDGSMHILPFSEVTKLTNMTKGFAFALVTVSVSYDSDIERVMDVLREVGAQVQEDPVFKRVILEPIEVMGIDSLGDSAITLQARMRTRPGKQWDVKRLLLLRIKQRFDLEKIEIPYPTVTSIIKTVDASPENKPNA